MAKIVNDPIGPADIQEYLDSTSDFAFELRTMKHLSEAGFDCKHGGYYKDPSTGKSRQFDIRASRHLGTVNDWGYRASLAVECKNLSANSPLLLMTVPRPHEESFHQIFAYSRNNAKAIEYKPPYSRYEVTGATAKSMAQVARLADKDKTISGIDSEVYEKWAQALSSAADLLKVPSGNPPHTWTFHAVLPILVVPDGMLWSVGFDENGNQLDGEAQQVTFGSVFVNHHYTVSLGSRNIPFVASHIDIVTTTGLRELAYDLVAGKTTSYRLFELSTIQQAFKG